MGIFDDMFGDVFGGAPQQPEESGGLMDFLLGGFSSTGHVSNPSGGGLFGFGGGYLSEPEVGLGGYREPILPHATQAMGYGGQPYSSQSEADKSCLMDGVVTDPDTGYTGTPQQIYDAYRREGRNPAPLMRRFHKRTMF